MLVGDQHVHRVAEIEAGVEEHDLEPGAVPAPQALVGPEADGLELVIGQVDQEVRNLVEARCEGLSGQGLASCTTVGEVKLGVRRAPNSKSETARVESDRRRDCMETSIQGTAVAYAGVIWNHPYSVGVWVRTLWPRSGRGQCPASPRSISRWPRQATKP